MLLNKLTGAMLGMRQISMSSNQRNLLAPMLGNREPMMRGKRSESALREKMLAKMRRSALMRPMISLME